MVNTAFTYENLTKRDVSFQLLRTNPKLTSNFKLTVDSDGSLWFNSIDATEELATQKYKKFPINEISSHEVNIHKFYDNGKTPSKVSFALGSTIRKDASAKDLKDQYDFDLYTSGAKYLTSRQYSEKFSYFAPIYLDTVLPKKFVIFKFPGASNYTAGDGKHFIPVISQSSFATGLFQNATIVKVFDLGPKSKIGKYIQTLVKNEMFNRSPLYINHRSGGYSLYRGASISAGTYVEMPERLDTIFSRSLPLLKVEQFVTEGFERNNIVHPRILNLEFLFDDLTSDPYSMNRYFGFYCNEVNLETMEIDLDEMYVNSITDFPDNETSLPTNYKQSDDITFNLTNPDGVVLRAKGLSQDLSDLYQNRTGRETLFFPYIKSKDDQLHLIKSSSWIQNDTKVTFSLDDITFDIGKLFGPSELVAQENVIPSLTNVRTTLRVELANKPHHLDKIRLYHPSGASYDQFGKYDDVVFVSGVFSAGESYSMHYLPGGAQIYVNLDRELPQIVQALCDLTFELNDSSIFGIRIDNSAFIQTRSFGDKYGELKALVIAHPVYSTETFYLNGKVALGITYGDGGFYNQPHPIVPTGNGVKLESLLNDVVVKTFTNWSTISRICNCCDFIKGDMSSDSQKTAIENYSKYEVLMLTDNEVVNTNYNKIEIRKLYKPVVGLLSMFELKDFDFSTYETSYSRNLILDLYKDYYIPDGAYVLDFSRFMYKVIGKGSVLINGVSYTSTDSFIWQNTTDLSKYDIVNGSPILIKTNYFPKYVGSANLDSFTRLDLPYFDANGDCVNYTGPFSLTAHHAAANTSIETYEYREKFLYGAVPSEYSVNLENYTTEFSSEGRIIPYISKWGIIDSSDSRDNSYRLNSDILFGKNNFGPSHNETIPTPEKMTHEWFYIESDFEYSNDESLLKKNYSYFQKPLLTRVLYEDHTYFDYYFTYIPKIGDIEIGRPQYRYSSLYQNRFSGQYETTFKGAKYIFSELDAYGKTLKSTKRFENYKFSAVLKPIKEDYRVKRQPIKYRVIENVTGKSITLLIELAIGSIDLIPVNLIEKNWNTPGAINEFSPAAIYLDHDSLAPNASLWNSIYIPSHGYETGDTVVYLTQGGLAIGGLINNEKYVIKKVTDDYVQLYTAYTVTAQEQVLFTSYGTNGPNLNHKLLGNASDLVSQLDIIKKFHTELQSSYSTVYKPINNSSQFAGILSGNTLLSSTLVGETVWISDGSDTAIIATPGTELFRAYENGKISTGDLLNDSISISATKGQVVLSSGIISAVKLVLTGSTLDSGEITITHQTPYYETTLGDYRVSFNDSDVSNLTHSFLYYAKNKKYNSAYGAFSTIKLSKGVNLSSNSGFNSSLGSIQLVDLSGIKSYDENANSEVNSVITNFSPVYIISSNKKQMLIERSSDPSYSIAVDVVNPDLVNPEKTKSGIIGANSRNLLIDRTSSFTYSLIYPSVNLTGSAQYTIGQVPAQSKAFWENANHFQIAGGEKYFEKVFENLSFAKLIKILEKTPNLISWETYRNGTKSTRQEILITADSGEEITKSTMLQISPISITYGQINGVAGFSISEVQSTEYQVTRYSGEYDAIFKQISSFKSRFSIGQNDLSGSNCCMNTHVDNFFIIPDFEYVKYSKTTILDLENSQNYTPSYPYINETPIDRAAFNILSSSWDYNYHFEYSTKSNKTAIPGTRRIAEDYSFISKLLNVPNQFTVEHFISSEVSQANFTNSVFGSSNLIYSTFDGEVRFKINYQSILANHLIDNGIRTEFEKFFKYEDSSQITQDPEFLGELTFEEYLNQYCYENLVKLYQVGSFDFYELEDRTISGNLVKFEEISYDGLVYLGYTQAKTVKINNTKSNVLEGSVELKPNSGLRIIPKIKINFI